MMNLSNEYPFQVPQIKDWFRSLFFFFSALLAYINPHPIMYRKYTICYVLMYVTRFVTSELCRPVFVCVVGNDECRK